MDQGWILSDNVVWEVESGRNIPVLGHRLPTGFNEIGLFSSVARLVAETKLTEEGG